MGRAEAHRGRRRPHRRARVATCRRALGGGAPCPGRRTATPGGARSRRPEPPLLAPRCRRRGPGSTSCPAGSPRASGPGPARGRTGERLEPAVAVRPGRGLGALGGRRGGRWWVWAPRCCGPRPRRGRWPAPLCPAGRSPWGLRPGRSADAPGPDTAAAVPAVTGRHGPCSGPSGEPALEIRGHRMGVSGPETGRRRTSMRGGPMRPWRTGSCNHHAE